MTFQEKYLMCYKEKSLEKNMVGGLRPPFHMLKFKTKNYNIKRGARHDFSRTQ